MTINKTEFSVQDENTGEIQNETGFIIDLITNEFPITITNVENKEDLKAWIMKVAGELFDKAWAEYESGADDRYIYQYGMIS